MQAGFVRITGGAWRSRKIAVANVAGLRPTPDRVRQTLFNWLGQDLTGWHCLDAFAGTGALGFEAASRGAATVQLVENDATCCAHLQTQHALFASKVVSIFKRDAIAHLSSLNSNCFDLVFLDPPFSNETIYSLALTAALHVSKPEGFVYLESAQLWDEARLTSCVGKGFSVFRYLQAGAVHAHLLRKV